MSEIKTKNPAVASKPGKVKRDEVALNIADDNGIENEPDEKKETGCCKTFCCCFVNVMPDRIKDVLLYQVPDVTWIVVGAIFGIIIGSMFGGEIDSTAELYLKLVGSMWMNGLKCVVTPFVFCNMVTSIADVLAMKSGKSMACCTFTWYFTTTLCAVTTGLIFANAIIIPNGSVVDTNANTTDVELLNKAVASKSTVISSNKVNSAEQAGLLLRSIIPSNFVGAFVKNNLLAVIFCSMVVGYIVKQGSMVLKFIRELNAICFKLIEALVLFTPFGVMSLVAATIATKNIASVMKDVALFLVTVFSALFFFAVIVYPSLFFLFTRQNPFTVMKNAMPAFLTALSTSSSAATFPMTYTCAVESNKVSVPVAKFVLSLGMTMNMDGTAIGFPCAVLFFATAQGMSLTFGQMVGMALVSALASMGAGPIPSAGLVMLVGILESVGLDPTSPIFGLIIAVDWLYDRPETALNIFGDSLGAVVVDKYSAKIANGVDENDDERSNMDLVRRLSKNKNSWAPVK